MTTPVTAPVPETRHCTIAAGSRTGDLGGTASTEDVTQAVLARCTAVP